jgi:hypothetical protein
LEQAYKNDIEFNFEALKDRSPFDLIHVGFSFDPSQDTELIRRLSSHLRPNVSSRMLAGYGSELCLFDAKGFRKEVAKIPGMAGIERGVFKRSLSRQERLARAKEELDSWKLRFEEKEKRKPSKADLFGDGHAAALFKEFSNATRLS